MSETHTDHWLRRSRELDRFTKRALCSRYRQMGGLGGAYPPERWTKEQVVTAIVEMEWDRLPADQKKADPPRMSPPCDVCGKGENATPAHAAGGDHHYRYTFNTETPWVPDDPQPEEPAMVPQPDTGEMVRAGSLYADKCAECTTGLTCEDAGHCTFEG